MSSAVTGVLDLIPQGAGFLRDADRSFKVTPDDPFVSQNLIRKFGLVAGATVTGPVRAGKKGPQLDNVHTICGLDPAAFRDRPSFKDLTALNPERRFDLGAGGHPSMRIIDLIAPIAYGTRGLIVSPPKTGKTTLLEDLARAMAADAPESRIVVLLIDERPEEDVP